MLALDDFTFEELFTPLGLARLDARFLRFLEARDAGLSAQLLAYREGKIDDARAVSQWIIDGAVVLECFLSDFFSIETPVAQLREQAEQDNPIFAFKKHFILREAKRVLHKAADFPSFATLDAWLTDTLIQEGYVISDRERAIAQYALSPQVDTEQLVAWCVQALLTPEGHVAVTGWVSFHLPAHLDYAHLVNRERIKWRHREGFQLTDPRMSAREVLDEVHYCVYCHKTEGDFCSKGFPVKKNDPEQGLKTNPLGEVLTGCPLEEKISEMHFLKKNGYAIAALATVMIDNPLCPATGHRICNDCMKACIYQKQEPVNIPQIETRVLTDVLSLPWGVEIYDLLVRWNPLRKTQWVAKPYNGKKILVMGMGPAGFTVAHHLLMEGFAVLGAEGLKIEPLPREYLTQPIKDYQHITEALDERIIAGFGGVAEYGITVRWDKNFLKLIYLSLLRRPYFQVYGSVRFGGTITVEDVWDLGFDHLAIAVGAGLPRELRIPQSLAPGMRQANDFLMALQLTGAAKATSLANLQIRLPAVVIGGGLTAIDTATEVQAYYLVEIEKVEKRYALLTNYYGESVLRRHFDKQSLSIIDEWLAHAKALQQEREQAQREQRLPRFIPLIRSWGGVTVVYRRRIQDSPAYQRNHEEVTKALEEGIYYLEALEPESVLVDKVGHVCGLACRNPDGSPHLLPARAILVATGATPNIAYAFEHRDVFARDGMQYQRFNEQGSLVTAPLSHCKDKDFGPFTSYISGHRRVSFLGDTHPVFHGSVVKAMASAQQIYPFITRSIGGVMEAQKESEYREFKQQMEGLFQAKVQGVIRHSKDLVELLVYAPIAARHFQPGEFYRVQNYETYAKKIQGTVLQTEALALLGMRLENDPHVLSFLIMERGASSRLVATWAVGEPLAVMGPTGVRTTITPTSVPQTLLMIGSTMAAIELRALAPALHAQGHQIIFVAINADDYAPAIREMIEYSADHVLWVQGEDWVSVLAAHTPPIGYNPVRVIAVGSPRLLQTLQQARDGVLRHCFTPETKFFGSVYGAMQCMLKGVCAQCLQWQVDPVTRQRTKAVYACSWQQQPLERIDTDHIDQRLSQNRAMEQLTNCWLDYVMQYDKQER